MKKITIISANKSAKNLPIIWYSVKINSVLIEHSNKTTITNHINEIEYESVFNIWRIDFKPENGYVKQFTFSYWWPNYQFYCGKQI